MESIIYYTYYKHNILLNINIMYTNKYYKMVAAINNIQ